MRPSERPTSWAEVLIAGLLHAGMFVLAYPPYDWWVLAFFAPLPLVLLALRTTDRRRAVAGVWLMSTLGFYWMDRWLIAVTLPGYLLVAPVHGLFAAVFVWLLARLRPRGGRAVLPGVSNVFLVPIVWVGLEVFRGRVLFGGYPWFLAGHPLIGAPVLCQCADLLGTYFVSFMALVPAGFTADVLTVPLFYKGRIAPTIRNGLVFFILIELATIGYGIVSLKTGDALKGRAVKIAALQTNLAQDNKIEWTKQQQVEDFARFVKLTLSLGGLDEYGEKVEDVSTLPIRPVEDVDLIVWPETMVPGEALNSDAMEATRQFTEANGLDGRPFTMFGDTLSRVAQVLGVPMLVGASAVEGLTFEQVPPGTQGSTAQSPKYERRWKHEYNSAILYDAEGNQSTHRYDKMHLTPFGEVIPLVHRWPSIQKLVMSIGAGGMQFDLSAGLRPERIPVPLRAPGTEGAGEESLLVATPICFESAMSDVCRKLVYQKGQRKADVLVNLTNDGWFNTMKGGREQHVQIGRFRCIENRVPMIVSANTGLSAAIDSSGRLVQVGPNDPPGVAPVASEGMMVASVELDGRLSSYLVVGDLFGWVCLGLTCGLIAAIAARRALEGQVGAAKKAERGESRKS